MIAEIKKNMPSTMPTDAPSLVSGIITTETADGFQGSAPATVSWLAQQPLPVEMKPDLLDELRTLLTFKIPSVTIHMAWDEATQNNKTGSALAFEHQFAVVSVECVANDTFAVAYYTGTATGTGIQQTESVHHHCCNDHCWLGCCYTTIQGCDGCNTNEPRADTTTEIADVQTALRVSLQQKAVTIFSAGHALKPSRQPQFTCTDCPLTFEQVLDEMDAQDTPRAHNLVHKFNRTNRTETPPIVLRQAIDCFDLNMQSSSVRLVESVAVADIHPFLTAVVGKDVERASEVAVTVQLLACELAEIVTLQFVSENVGRKQSFGTVMLAECSKGMANFLFVDMAPAYMPGVENLKGFFGTVAAYSYAGDFVIPRNVKQFDQSDPDHVAICSSNSMSVGNTTAAIAATKTTTTKTTTTTTTTTTSTCDDAMAVYRATTVQLLNTFEPTPLTSEQYLDERSRGVAVVNPQVAFGAVVPPRRVDRQTPLWPTGTITSVSDDLGSTSYLAEVKAFVDYLGDITSSTTVDSTTRDVCLKFIEFESSLSTALFNCVDDRDKDDFVAKVVTRAAARACPDPELLNENIAGLEFAQGDYAWILNKLSFKSVGVTYPTFLNIWKEHDAENGCSNWLITTVQGKTDIAPDMQVTRLTESKYWGASSQEKVQVEYLPHVLTTDDIRLLAAFFERMMLASQATVLKQDQSKLPAWPVLPGC